MVESNQDVLESEQISSTDSDFNRSEIIEESEMFLQTDTNEPEQACHEILVNSLNVDCIIILLQGFLRNLHTKTYIVSGLWAAKLKGRESNGVARGIVEELCGKIKVDGWVVSGEELEKLFKSLDGFQIVSVGDKILNREKKEKQKKELVNLSEKLVNQAFSSRKMPFFTVENNNLETITQVYLDALSILDEISASSLILQLSDEVIISIIGQNPENLINEEISLIYNQLITLFESRQSTPNGSIQLLLSQSFLLANTKSSFLSESSQFSCEALAKFQEFQTPSLLSQPSAQLSALAIEELRISYTDSEGNIFLSSFDLTKELSLWENLIQSLSESSKVTIGSSIISLKEAKTEINTLESALKILSKTNSILIISDGNASLQDPIIKNSEELSSEAFETFTEAISANPDSVPIISTTDSSEEIITGDGTATILLPSSEMISDTQRSETTPLENVLYESASYLILTTYITGKFGTGKIWVLPLENPSLTYLLLEGFQVPTSVCFDSAHMFLYIVDHGRQHGSIFQYQVVYDQGIDLETEIYVEVYTGNPSDCKVDSYGNLYFLDSKKNSINIITYPDLYSGFKNRFLTIYSATKEKKKLNRPVRFDFDSNYQNLYYVNSAIGFGILNKVVTEVEGPNEEEILSITHEKIPAWGIASNDKILYYSLQNGDIKAYDLEYSTSKVISSGFFITPKGLCFAHGVLYVADHGKGAVFAVADGKNPELIANIQAVEGIFCLNQGFLFAATYFIIALG